METNQILAPELELQRIHDDHPNLVSTGCSKDFCQAGRLNHDDEPRVGKNRALQLVEQEAVDFLQTLHFEGFYEDDLAFQHRLHEVRQEIRDGATKINVQEEDSNNANKCVEIGGNWTQTSSELEFGIRRAWRNSRKCIIRSHCEDLKLCDLRDVTSSVQMVAELLKKYPRLSMGAISYRQHSSSLHVELVAEDLCSGTIRSSNSQDTRAQMVPFWGTLIVSG